MIERSWFDLFPHLVRYAPDVAETERIINECVRAISAGRLIDFGAWTDEVFIHGGNRGHPMYVAGAIADASDPSTHYMTAMTIVTYVHRPKPRPKAQPPALTGPAVARHGGASRSR